MAAEGSCDADGLRVPIRATSKGQITIPRAICQRWGLPSHTKVHFVEEGGRVFLEKDSGQFSRGQDGVQRLQQARPAGDPASFRL
ncbi:MAG: AbrB/MazE/SpoVT family DNA-binding domain-containing protein [Synechococcaceae cyanobacterium]|nr:AbrB/MazE/SpoVT family DNA-binding domain-containing protein [Synechococcaceae cyanobacterium]